MSNTSPKNNWWKIGLGLLVVLLIVVVLAVPQWRANVMAQLKRLSTAPTNSTAAAEDSASDPHAGHDHAHEGEQDENVLTLSREARANIGLKIGVIELQEYTKTVSLPGIVTEIPGRSRMQISAPLTGIVTGIEIIAGETVKSGDVVFRLRLTHEDLVTAQTEFLRTLGQLDVEQKEVARLKVISESGALAGKVLLEKLYEVEKLDAILHAFREALLLHGLSREQIMQIEQHRSLLREVKLTVPFLHQDDSIHNEIESYQRDRTIQRVSHSQPNDRSTSEEDDHLREAWFSVKEVNVHKGESVQAGTTLGVLTNYQKLYLEGHAYEQDIPKLSQIVEANRDISLVFQNSTQDPERLSGMKVKYLSNEVNPETRTYHFYVELNNKLIRPEDSIQQTRFLNWKYKPGQRAYVELPVDHWEDKIILPREAVVDEAASAFIFLKEEADQYRRVEVRVLHRDRENAVIQPTKELEGKIVALRGARQMFMALERAAGGGGGHDHHGHSH
ncbi:MAG: efflux RND transporter periplasmic adaptor subunit [Planctomycetaceae bacterium]|nr:efflux RND transporter periplasmic adaptor subunit [Planctomycetaceae bacterium]